MMHLCIIIGCLLIPFNAFCATLHSVVKNEKGEPVKDAVVYVNVVNVTLPPMGKPQEVELDQVNKEFVPYVTPIRVGTPVRFPNKDNIRHHVYSISPAKKFELPLYEGVPASPVVFDKPGEVILGCNIHDWMVAYIYVLETPYFAKTGEDGIAEIHDLVKGTYEVQVWHPLMKESTESTGRSLSISDKEADSNIEFIITKKPDWRPWRMPEPENGSYR